MTQHTIHFGKNIILDKLLFRFIQGVQQHHEKPDSLREEQVKYVCNSELLNPMQDTLNTNLWDTASHFLDEDQIGNLLAG